jgi:hypothetical protein
LSHSVDGIDYVAVARSLRPTDNPDGQWYPADVFRFAPVETRFLRLDMSGCPQGGGTSYCAIGEVAFDAVSVPEPAPLGLLGLGLGLAGLATLRPRTGRTGTPPSPG